MPLLATCQPAVLFKFSSTWHFAFQFQIHFLPPRFISFCITSQVHLYDGIVKSF